MNEEELKDKIAHLESVNDQLETEISQIDELMRLLGFADGLETVKETANEIFWTENSGGDNEPFA